MKHMYFNQPVFIRIFTFVVLFLLLNGAVWGGTAVSAAPEAIPVPCFNGTGDTSSLISAIEQANEQPGHDVIELGTNCTYRLFEEFEEGSGLPFLKDDTTIEGNGATIFRQPSAGPSVKFNLLSLGEGISFGGTDIILKDLSLQNGDTLGDGAAFYAAFGENYVNLTLENVSVQNNIAAGTGGGIYVQSPGTVTIINSNFNGNKALHGGGVYWDGEDSGQLSIIDDTSFSENEINGVGGGLYAEFGNINIGQTSFLRNSSGSGGGMYLVNDITGKIEDVTFHRNEAVGRGGGLFNSTRSNPQINDVIFSKNTASTGAGMQNEYDSQLILTDVTFIENIASTNGGGMNNWENSHPFLINVTFRGNQAAKLGGGFRNVTDSNPLLINVLFSGNSSGEYGGGMYSQNRTNPVLVNATFSGNWAAEAGGGLANSHNSESRLVNSILWNNADATGTGTLSANLHNFINTTSHLAYTLLQGSGGSDDWHDDASTDHGYNIDAAPSFVESVDPKNAPTIDGDFQLKENSAAIDVGHTDSNEIAVDLAGNPRLQNGVIDLGAYESPYRANTAPDAISDGYIAYVNETLIVERSNSILNNDSDADGDELTAVLIQDVQNGNLTLHEDGTFEYAPDSDFAGIDGFFYAAFDGAEQSGPRVVELYVTEVANDDQYDGVQDTQLIIDATQGILVNDFARTFATPRIDDGVEHGELILRDDGSFTYTPEQGFVGEDRFVYFLEPLLEDSILAPATVTIVIREQPNQPPVALDDAYSVDENETLNVSVNNGVLVNDSDPDGDELQVNLIDEPNAGDLDLDGDGAFRYTPAADFFGEVSFTYQADDGNEQSGTATVRIAVHEVNGRPVAEDDVYSVDENEMLDLPATNGVLNNDSDADGDELEAGLVEEPQFGDLDLDADGSFFYIPNAGFSGEDSFTYQADDGKDLSETATVRITIHEVNTRPVAVDDVYQLDQDTVLIAKGENSVLTNDGDQDGDILEAVLVTEPAHGVLLFSALGELDYEPEPGFFGTDQFTYQASDGKELSNVATVTLTVEKVNIPPVAENDAYVVLRGGELQVPVAGVLANDVDADGDRLTAVLFTPPNQGTLDLQADGGFIYAPEPNFLGVAHFTYVANDGEADSESATVTILVNSTNTNIPPQAAPDFYATMANETLTVAVPGVLLNDRDSNGDGLTAVLDTQPQHGTLTFQPDGSFVYVPNLDFTGSDSFTYHAADQEANSDPVTVTIEIAPLPDPEPTLYQLFLPIVIRSN